jgi:hypothetical protein
MIRRSFLRKLAAVPLFAAAAAVPAATTNSTKLKILLKSAWGSDDPTKAAFPFLHGDVLSESGRVRRKIRQPYDLCFTSGMGRQNHH